jgi:hypothetical protein
MLASMKPERIFRGACRLEDRPIAFRDPPPPGRSRIDPGRHALGASSVWIYVGSGIQLPRMSFFQSLRSIAQRSNFVGKVSKITHLRDALATIQCNTVLARNVAMVVYGYGQAQGRARMYRAWHRDVGTASKEALLHRQASSSFSLNSVVFLRLFKRRAAGFRLLR